MKLLSKGSCSTAFLVPQEAAHLRELLESLREIGIHVEHRFVTSSVMMAGIVDRQMPAISFKTAELIRFEDEGSDRGMGCEVEETSMMW